MRTPEECKAAIRQMRSVQEGAAVQQDTTKEAFCSRICDVLNWAQGLPSEFEGQLAKLDEIDRLANAHKKARAN